MQRVKYITIINTTTDATTAITTMTSAAAATITINTAVTILIISICIPLSRYSMCIVTRLYYVREISLQRKEILRFSLAILSFFYDLYLT